MARKKNHEEHENHERWMVSYACPSDGSMTGMVRSDVERAGSLAMKWSCMRGLSLVL